MKRKLGILAFTLGLLAILAGTLFSSAPAIRVSRDQFKPAHHQVTGNSLATICESIDTEDNISDHPVFVFDAGKPGIFSAAFGKNHITFSACKQRVNMLPALPVHFRTCTLLI